MPAPPTRPIVFCAAAGPRVGFGHLVRCCSLARALGTPLLGAARQRRNADRARGATLVRIPSAAALRTQRVARRDRRSSPVAAARWVARAAGARACCLSIHDLGSPTN
ncbi:MAG: hypothetical protein R2712_05075 [Vicinamibacterales bacterium]